MNKIEEDIEADIRVLFAARNPTGDFESFRQGFLVGLEERKGMLENIISDTLWMARRYADGRKTYVTYEVNQAIDEAERLGIKVELEVQTGKKYASDGMFGEWVPEKQTFEKGDHFDGRNG